MNNSLKTRLQNACPLMAGLIEFLEAREAKSAVVETADVNVEQTVTFPSTSRLVSFMFVNSSGAEEGIDVYDITTSGFKYKAGSEGTLYYKTDEVSA
jgi:hypothetical protein